ncbi:iron uptake porin, partial [Leptolyngbya sp. FACHB-36]|uniref:iron uptake porin n=1 Tax=Leptolyngbya sp. FACHB-36 TaxID=2692808 RepID=UPI00321FF0B6
QTFLLLSPVVLAMSAASASAAIAEDQRTPTPIKTALVAPSPSGASAKPADESEPAKLSAPVPSAPEVNRLVAQAEDMDQVTSVSQLSDVRPTDWAFQALQSLVERYGCIVGYPDRTYRGNRALTRYEFAAGLNACIDRINELIASATADLVRKEDLVTLQRLQEEFRTELLTLRGRVDALEARTTELEANQFSTTTKLNGEIVLGLISVLGGDRADGSEADRVPTLGYRVRLNLDTSFSGRDLLTTRIQASNVVPLGGSTFNGGGTGPLQTNEGRIEFDGDSGGSAGIGLLRYRFPLTENTDVYIAGTGNGFVDVDGSSQLNPYFDGGSVSLFGLRNSIYNYSYGAGIGIRHFFGNIAELNLAYLTPTANNPSAGQGLLEGQYAAEAQLIFNPRGNIRVGLTYINAYRPFPENLGPNDTFALVSTGSNLANANFGRPVSVNAFGATATVNFSRNLALSGWVGYAQQRYIGRGDGDVWHWAVGLAFPNLGKPGNLGGIIVGMEPKLTGIDSSVNGGAIDRDTSLHVEGFYRYRISDNVAITPGVIWLTAPNHDARNDDVFVGVVRTVFFF